MAVLGIPPTNHRVNTPVLGRLFIPECWGAAGFVPAPWVISSSPPGTLGYSGLDDKLYDNPS